MSSIPGIGAVSAALPPATTTPAVASTTPRSCTTLRSAARLTGAEGAWYGPSRTAPKRSAPAASADPAAASMVRRHVPMGMIARTRCGDAEPIVRAPTSTPIAIPRRSFHHPATSFIPGG